MTEFAETALRQPQGGITRVDNLEKVLDRLATSEKTAIVLKHAPGGKMRVTSGSWGRREGDLRDQVLDVPNVDNRLHLARKPRKPDKWDRSSLMIPTDRDSPSPVTRISSALTTSS